MANLKEYLKGEKMSQSGDKPTLWARCKLRHQVTTGSLRTSDGEDPCTLNPSGLRKVSARAGLSPIGSNDELLISLVAHLARQRPAASAADGASSSSTQPPPSSGAPTAGGGRVDPVALAQRVLSLADDAVADPSVVSKTPLLFLAACDRNAANGSRVGGCRQCSTHRPRPPNIIRWPPPLQVLRLADPTASGSSPTAVLRKAYLKISLAIHPDRLGRAFPDATKAFQVRPLDTSPSRNKMTHRHSAKKEKPCITPLPS